LFMGTNARPAARIFVKFVIVDLHKCYFRKFKFRLTWTIMRLWKCLCQRYSANPFYARLLW